MLLPLIIGGLALSSFDAPEQFGPIGGRQAVVKHEFPGGLITQQELGAFPDSIRWRGTLLGRSAFAEQRALDQLRVSGQDTTLKWGIYSWLGKVTQFAAHAKHAYLIPYEIEFSPSQDLSGAGAGLGGPSFSNQDNIDLAAAIGAIADMANAAAIAGVFTFPPVLVPSASALTSAVSTGLSKGDGTVAGLQPADVAAITSSAAAAQAAALDIMAGANQADAFVASNFWAQSSTIASLVPTSTSTIAQFIALNPNLFQIAVQYYGDATLWILIAEASRVTEGVTPGASLLPYDDPQPIGAFLITVPPAPAATGKCGCATNLPGFGSVSVV